MLKFKLVAKPHVASFLLIIQEIKMRELLSMMSILPKNGKEVF